jgi:RNA polymerase sigma-70 factor (ECF subfamily)
VRSVPPVAADVVTAESALAEALRRGDATAKGDLYDRYATHVQRVLVRVLGTDRDLADLLQEVFARAFAGIGGLDDGTKIKAWLSSIAVFTARETIRRRSRGRWLQFVSFDEMPDALTSGASPEVSRALKTTYAVLERMPEDERIAFALRFIDGMELTEVAEACSVSLATIKRHLARAEQRFATLAHKEPSLAEWLEGGTRWRS